ncbi:MAG: DinB family protein [Bacteroidota bacterium]
MQIQNTKDFLAYYARIRQRTLKVIDCIPQDQLEWTPQVGRFTLGDQVRHIAAIERYMYAETILGKPSRYRGCGSELAEGFEETLAFMNRLREESIAIFRSLSAAQLNEKCLTPTGHPITIWKWLRALIEHEIHHRGQIYLYLGLLEVKTPPIFGLTSEEVAALSDQ